ncbi:MAG: L-threonylcarbamoyladenylate synthase [Brachymonas sp.]|nr:L-threonylcarbamoyladenylate synthase [Brachymonas sp.]
MASLIDIHPVNPQARNVKQAVALLARGEVLAAPTDSGYALMCHLDDKAASDRLRQLRGVDDKHHLTLLCRDLSELSHYARVDNRQYRLLKQGTPGPFTFILEATKELPRRLSHPSRKTIGLRVPAHAVLQAILEEHGSALLSTTLILPGEDAPLYEADEIETALGRQLAAIVDAGPCAHMPTTVVDLTGMDKGGDAVLVREGAGDPAVLGL